MGIKNFLQIVAAIYICVVLFFWVYSFFKGLKIVKYLKLNHSGKWKELDKPYPNYLNSVSVRKWRKLISQKGYLLLNDKNLSQLCEAQKKLERNTVILTVSFLV